MRRRSQGLSIVLVAFVLLALAPSTARAQVFLAPYVGADFGGNAGRCPSLFTDCTEKRRTYGVGVGKLPSGILGFELDFAYAPDFFGTSAAFDSNSVLTLMGNLLVSIPVGPIRPYATAGAGMVRTRVAFTAKDVLSFHDSTFGYNVGGGVMFLLPSHLGVRGDIRYFRSGSDISIAGIGLRASTLNFARVSIGLVLH
jgi:opacity protein-like surface antigen